MTSRAVVLTSLLMLALAGCGGGGGGVTPSSSPTNGGGSPTTPGGPTTPSGSIRFVIPAKGSSSSSSLRGAKFVSPSSAAIKVTINSINGNTSIPNTIPNPEITNLTVGAGAPCAVNSGVETCTVPIAVPTGSVSYTFDLYDGNNGTGNHLATGTQTFTNVAGTNPPVNVALSGIVASIAVGTSASLALETPGNVQLSIVPQDADGNTITGTAVYFGGSLVVTDNDTSGTTGLTLGASATSGVGTSSVTVTSGANDVIYLNYNGEPSSDPNFTITSQFTSSSPVNGNAVDFSLTSFSGSSTNSYSGGSTVSFPSAGGFSGTMNLGTPTSSTTGNVTTVTTAAAPSEGAPSSILRKAAAVRRTKSIGGAETLAYFEVTFANQYIFANQPPTFAVTLPASIVDPAATYYVAFYDPITSTWNDDFADEGGIHASGDTLTFSTASTAPFFFAAGTEYDFAILDLPSGNTAPTGTTPATLSVTGTTTCDASAGCAPSDVDYEQPTLFFDSDGQTASFGISESGITNFLVVQLPNGNLSPESDCVSTPVATAPAAPTGNPTASVTATSTSTTGICEVLVIGDELAGSNFWYSNTSASIGLTGKNRRQ